MSNITVFGGSGFLGSHVVEELASRGHQVLIFDIIPHPKNSKFNHVMGDIRNKDDTIRAIAGADYVYNFAGIANLDSASTMAIETAEYNIIGNINILEGCKQNDVKKLLYASSIYVYSDKGGFYRCSKQASELYVEEFKRKYDLDYTIMRYGSLYGSRSAGKSSIHSYIKQALTDKKVTYNGTGNEVREYIHVRDAARLSANMMNTRYDNKHTIMTGHNAMKVDDMFEMLQETINNGFIINKKVPAADHDHYNITPYSFNPKIGQKVVSNEYVDFGQGLLECVEEIYQEIMNAKK